jgi:hypothetical protein
VLLILRLRRNKEEEEKKSWPMARMGLQIRPTTGCKAIKSIPPSTSPKVAGIRASEGPKDSQGGVWRILYQKTFDLKLSGDEVNYTIFGYY